MKKIFLVSLLFLCSNIAVGGVDSPIYQQIKIQFTGKNLVQQEGRHLQVWLKKNKRGDAVPVIRLNINDQGQFHKVNKNGAFSSDRYNYINEISAAKVAKSNLLNSLYGSRIFVTLEPTNDFALGGEFNMSTVIMSGLMTRLIPEGKSVYVAVPVWSPIIHEFEGSEFSLILEDGIR